VNFESIIVSLSSSHEYFPLVKLVGHIKVRHSARCVHVCAVRSLPDEAIWRFPYYLSLKKSLPFFKRRWNNRNNSGIISGIISESDSSIIPIPSGLGRLSQIAWLCYCMVMVMFIAWLCYCMVMFTAWLCYCNLTEAYAHVAAPLHADGARAQIYDGASTR
jgi:hypothetical protein